MFVAISADPDPVGYSDRYGFQSRYTAGCTSLLVLSIQIREIVWKTC